jgi:type 1 fimbriae regulatory protein FimB/type 1 fimbriae regulatory protein FimE
MGKSHLKLVTPTTVKRTVTPKRLPNVDLRTREHLTEAEVERLVAVARKNRWGHRDATMILVAIVMASDLSNLWTSAGIRSSSLRGRCTFAE